MKCGLFLVFLSVLVVNWVSGGILTDKRFPPYYYPLDVSFLELQQQQQLQPDDRLPFTIGGTKRKIYRSRLHKFGRVPIQQQS